MQKDTVEVIINADGKTCTTVNPLMEPEVGREKLYSSQDTSSKSQFYHEDWHKRHKAWQQAESERKTYEIASCDKKCPSFCRMPCFKPGTIHKARIGNGKAVII